MNQFPHHSSAHQFQKESRLLHYQPNCPSSGPQLSGTIEPLRDDPTVFQAKRTELENRKQSLSQRIDALITRFPSASPGQSQWQQYKQKFEQDYQYWNGSYERIAQGHHDAFQRNLEELLKGYEVQVALRERGPDTSVEQGRLRFLGGQSWTMYVPTGKTIEFQIGSYVNRQQLTPQTVGMGDLKTNGFNIVRDPNNPGRILITTSLLFSVIIDNKIIDGSAQNVGRKQGQMKQNAPSSIPPRSDEPKPAARSTSSNQTRPADSSSSPIPPETPTPVTSMPNSVTESVNDSIENSDEMKEFNVLMQQAIEGRVWNSIVANTKKTTLETALFSAQIAQTKAEKDVAKSEINKILMEARVVVKNNAAALSAQSGPPSTPSPIPQPASEPNRTVPTIETKPIAPGSDEFNRRQNVVLETVASLPIDSLEPEEQKAHMKKAADVYVKTMTYLSETQTRPDENIQYVKNALVSGKKLQKNADVVWRDNAEDGVMTRSRIDFLIYLTQYLLLPDADGQKKLWKTFLDVHQKYNDPKQRALSANEIGGYILATEKDPQRFPLTDSNLRDHIARLSAYPDIKAFIEEQRKMSNDDPFGNTVPGSPPNAAPQAPDPQLAAEPRPATELPKSSIASRDIETSKEDLQTSAQALLRDHNATILEISTLGVPKGKSVPEQWGIQTEATILSLTIDPLKSLAQSEVSKIDVSSAQKTIDNFTRALYKYRAALDAKKKPYDDLMDRFEEVQQITKGKYNGTSEKILV